MLQLTASYGQKLTRVRPVHVNTVAVGQGVQASVDDLRDEVVKNSHQEDLSVLERDCQKVGASVGPPAASVSSRGRH